MLKLTTKTVNRKTGGRHQTAYPGSLPADGKDPYYHVEFFHNGEWIGEILLCQTKYGFWETHSYLCESYRGQGLGIKMYATIIRRASKRGWEVRSSTSTSDMAKRVWRSSRLRKEFRIHKTGKRFKVL